MKNKIRLMCLAGVFTAIVFVFTAYVHIPNHTGYTHIGDGFIYLCATLLPLPYSIFAGATGALFADLFSGYAIWAPGTVIIKAVTVLYFSRQGKMLSVRNLLALIPAGLTCIAGYCLYEAAITANFVAPLAGIPGYVTQWVLSSAVFVIVAMIFDKLGFKKLILK